jgi:hypothetical protein
MAQLQFPANPALDEVYEQYTWNGSEWVLTSSATSFVEEAPADNTPYVRYNLSWISWADARDITAQLADIIDGGDFDSGLSETANNTIFDGGDFDLGTSVAFDSEIIDGGLFVPAEDNIIDGGLAT